MDLDHMQVTIVRHLCRVHCFEQKPGFDYVKPHVKAGSFCSDRHTLAMCICTSTSTVAISFKSMILIDNLTLGKKDRLYAC